MYDRLFASPYPDRDADDFKQHLNPDSLEVLVDAALEPALAQSQPEERFQFERQGYFMIDAELSDANQLVFTRTVTLRNSWAKIERQALQKTP